MKATVSFAETAFACLPYGPSKARVTFSLIQFFRGVSSSLKPSGITKAPLRLTAKALTLFLLRFLRLMNQPFFSVAFLPFQQSGEFQKILLLAHLLQRFADCSAFHICFMVDKLFNHLDFHCFTCLKWV